MTKAQERAVTGLVVAVLATAAFQFIAKQEAAILGLTAAELAILGAAASAFVGRVLRA